MRRTWWREGRQFFGVDADDDRANALLRDTEGRRWHGKGAWSLPEGPRAEKIAAKLSIELPERLRSGIVGPVPAHYWARLFPFQRDDVAWHMARPRSLDWSEQGTGKTPKAVAWAAGAGRVLVVCPLAVTEQWVEEVRLSTVSRTLDVINSKGNPEVRWGDGPGTSHWTICSFERAKKVSIDDGFSMIVDEVTYCKSMKAARTKALLALGDKAARVLALSGHPMVNRPLELWPLFLLMRQRTQKEFWPWVQQYTGAYKTPYGWDMSGATHLADLRDDLAGFGLRRTKAEVMPFLPPKLQVTIRVPKADLREVNKAANEVGKYVLRGESTKFGEGFGALQHMRQECANSKVNFAADWLEQHFEGGGGKVLVFSQFKAPLDALRSQVPGMLVIDGDVSQKERPGIIAAFTESKEHSVLGLTYGVGALGLNLQAADTVVILDLPWTPMELEQAGDRAHRFGQTRPVNIVTLLSGHPVETQIHQSLMYKEDINEALKTFDWKAKL